MSSLRRPLFGLVTCFCLGLVLFSDTTSAASVTLQQGLNGYSGCSDSFIVNGAYPESRSQNFGHAGELRIACSHYASW